MICKRISDLKNSSTPIFFLDLTNNYFAIVPFVGFRSKPQSFFRGGGSKFFIFVFNLIFESWKGTCIFQRMK